MIEGDPFRFFDEKNKTKYIDMLERAIKTLEEQECETWREYIDDSGDKDSLCIRTTVRLIGKSDGSYLFYALVRNVTQEKQSYLDLKKQNDELLLQLNK